MIISYGRKVNNTFNIDLPITFEQLLVYNRKEAKAGPTPLAKHYITSSSLQVIYLR
ncbi:hypothetical protein SAMN05216352_10719 [Alteribacillus bidgolensis]|uniref:Uncharacterized protein n=1 Tax=Alteribacillus bidgolensis TaxID=930129 RepID=A0A1G8K170_9BACI|nr:hypothetical protein SAMN05216352_10719 [Alteribacillus bidgolensis]